MFRKERQLLKEYAVTLGAIFGCTTRNQSDVLCESSLDQLQVTTTEEMFPNSPFGHWSAVAEKVMFLQSGRSKTMSLFKNRTTFFFSRPNVCFTPDPCRKFQVVVTPCHYREAVMGRGDIPPVLVTSNSCLVVITAE